MAQLPSLFFVVFSSYINEPELADCSSVRSIRRLNNNNNNTQPTMKFFIAFSVAMIASASATYVAPAVGYAAGIVNTGSSAVSRSDDVSFNVQIGVSIHF